MGSLLKRTNNLILMGMIACSYMLWVIGIDTGTTSFIYNNYSYILVLSLVILTIINIGNLEKKDYLFILFCFGIFVFYTLTSPIRHSNHLLNLVIPIVLLLIFFFRKSTFDKVDVSILIIINAVAFGSTLYRLYKDVPHLIAPISIWEMGNKIVSIWINTNTIGASILFSVMMLTIMIRSLGSNWFNLVILPIYAAGGMAIWVCQAKAAMYALIFFIVVDAVVVIIRIFLKKSGQRDWMILIVFTLLFIIAPFIFYFMGKMTSGSLFTERVRIWEEVFQQWLPNKRSVIIGMEPFIASWKPLGTHNAFMNILRNYGIVGYTLFFTPIVYWIYLKVKTQRVSQIEASLFVAFFAICIHSFMEDVLVAPYWLPIALSFLGMALQKKSCFSVNRFEK